MKKKAVKKLRKKLNQKAGKRVLAHLVALSQQMPSNLILQQAKMIKAKKRADKSLSLQIKMVWSQNDDSVSDAPPVLSLQPINETADIVEVIEKNEEVEVVEIKDNIDNIPKVRDAVNHDAMALQEAQLEVSQLKQTISEINDKNSYLESLLDECNREIREQEEEIKELRQKLQYFNSLTNEQENAIKNKRANGDNALLQYGKERDLYDDEILSFLRRSMEYTLKNQTHENSRYRHIMEDLLNANPLPNDLRAEKEKALQQTMKTYTRMDNPTRQALINIGFSITEEGTHYKLVFMKDGRYTCSTSKTSSDIRGGRNFVRDVANLLF